MIKTILALTIVCGSMFATIKVLDFIFALWRILPQSPEVRHKSIRSRIIEAILEAFEWSNFSTNNTTSINGIGNTCEIEASAACDRVAADFEGLEEGIQAAIESAGEHIINAIEGLSNS